MMRAFLLLIFIAVPLTEIAIFIQVGSLIGLWRTIAAILITAIIGVSLLRYQGLATLARAQATLDEGRLPVDSLLHGVLLLIAGALLLTPGFLTDTIGFALLVPALRLWIGKRIWALLKNADATIIDGTFETSYQPPPRHGDSTPGRVIEGEVVDRDASPWREPPVDPDEPRD